jgi:hypothetical protein
MLLICVWVSKDLPACLKVGLIQGHHGSWVSEKTGRTNGVGVISVDACDDKGWVSECELGCGMVGRRGVF